MKFRIVFFEAIAGVFAGKDFVKFKFKQVDNIGIPPSTAELLLERYDLRIPNLINAMNTGELIENPFAESE